jgi:hypothetical protein
MATRSVSAPGPCRPGRATGRRTGLAAEGPPAVAPSQRRPPPLRNQCCAGQLPWPDHASVQKECGDLTPSQVIRGDSATLSASGCRTIVERTIREFSPRATGAPTREDEPRGNFLSPAGRPVMTGELSPQRYERDARGNHDHACRRARSASAASALRLSRSRSACCPCSTRRSARSLSRLRSASTYPALPPVSNAACSSGSGAALGIAAIIAKPIGTVGRGQISVPSPPMPNAGNLIRFAIGVRAPQVSRPRLVSSTPRTR